MTTCNDKSTQQDAADAMQKHIDRLMVEYFHTKMADYFSRQLRIAEEQGRAFDIGHLQAFAMHIYEAGMEIGGLLQAFGVSVRIGDTPRDGTDETLTYCDPDGPKRCLVAGDAPTWMNPENESEFCKIMINAMQMFSLPNKGVAAMQEAQDGE